MSFRISAPPFDHGILIVATMLYDPSPPRGTSCPLLVMMYAFFDAANLAVRSKLRYGVDIDLDQLMLGFARIIHIPSVPTLPIKPII
jgi:hypothetical protein